MLPLGLFLCILVAKSAIHIFYDRIVKMEFEVSTQPWSGRPQLMQYKLNTQRRALMCQSLYKSVGFASTCCPFIKTFSIRLEAKPLVPELMHYTQDISLSVALKLCLSSILVINKHVRKRCLHQREKNMLLSIFAINQIGRKKCQWSLLLWVMCVPGVISWSVPHCHMLWLSSKAC